MIQIFDDGQVLRIINGSETFNWSKDLLSVSYDSKINLFSGGNLVLQIADYTEVTVPAAVSKADLGAKISKMINEAGAYDGRKMLVGNVREKFKDEFFSFDTVENWTLVQTGPGMVISVAGVANGSRYLNIASGVTPNAETIIISKKLFNLPFRAVGALTLSQRIANTEAYFEVVEVDASGNVIEDITLGGSPTVRNARNAAGYKFDGVTVNNALYYSRAGATPELVSASTAFGTNISVATGAGPNFLPAFMFDLALATENVIWQVNPVDSSSAGTYVKRNQCVPESGPLYAVRIRLKNLAAAPATSTDLRVHFVRVLDSSRVSVDFAQIAGRADAQNAPMVQANIVNTANVAVTGTPSVIMTPGIFNDSVTNLAASATFTGVTRDGGAANVYRRFVAFGWALQAGTMRIEMSNDGATWRPVTLDTAVAANTPVQLDIPVVTRYYRVIFINGATAQTGFMVNSAFHKI